MKEKYEELEMEVIEFETEDVITTSTGSGGGQIGAWLDPNQNPKQIHYIRSEIYNLNYTRDPFGFGCFS